MLAVVKSNTQGGKIWKPWQEIYAFSINLHKHWGRWATFCVYRSNMNQQSNYGFYSMIFTLKPGMGIPFCSQTGNPQLGHTCHHGFPLFMTKHDTGSWLANVLDRISDSKVIRSWVFDKTVRGAQVCAGGRWYLILAIIVHPYACPWNEIDDSRADFIQDINFHGNWVSGVQSHVEPQAVTYQVRPWEDTLRLCLNGKTISQMVLITHKWACWCCSK